MANNKYYTVLRPFECYAKGDSVCLDEKRAKRLRSMRLIAGVGLENAVSKKTGKENALSAGVKAEAEKVKAEAEKVKAEAEQMKAEAEQMKAEAEQVKAEAEKVKAEAEQMKAEAEKAKEEAEKGKKK